MQQKTPIPNKENKNEKKTKKNHTFPVTHPTTTCARSWAMAAAELLNSPHAARFGSCTILTTRKHLGSSVIFKQKIDTKHGGGHNREGGADGAFCCFFLLLFCVGDRTRTVGGTPADYRHDTHCRAPKTKYACVWHISRTEPSANNMWVMCEPNST